MLLTKLRDLLLYPFDMHSPAYYNHGDSNYNTGYKYKKQYTTASLKKEIKAGFKEELRIAQKWHVIPMEWFDKWKLYVNYDDDLNEVRCLLTCNILFLTIPFIIARQMMSYCQD